MQRTSQQAVDIIRRYQVFVSAQFLVGSRQDGRFVVVEKTPTQTVVREPSDAGFTICANHYMTAALTNDPINLKYMQADTSLPRYARMAGLLQRNVGTLDTTRSASILRDRELPGDRFAGNGHRSSLNPLIATHSVIMDLTGGIFWAATPPHQMGRFAAFDIHDPEKSQPELAVAGDPMLTDGEYTTYLAAKAGLSDGWRALKHDDLAAAINYAQSADKNNPGFYQNSWLLAEVMFRQGKYPEAAAACRQALDGKPALGSERRRIERLLNQAETHK